MWLIEDTTRTKSTKKKALLLLQSKHMQTWIIGSRREDITGLKLGLFTDADNIMLLYVPIISSSTDTPSLTACGGERSAATRGGYRKSFSPLLLRMSKNVFWAASFSTQSVLHRAVSLPSKSEIYISISVTICLKGKGGDREKKDTSSTVKLTDGNLQYSCKIPVCC